MPLVCQPPLVEKLSCCQSCRLTAANASLKVGAGFSYQAAVRTASASCTKLHYTELVSAIEVKYAEVTQRVHDHADRSRRVVGSECTDPGLPWSGQGDAWRAFDVAAGIDVTSSPRRRLPDPVPDGDATACQAPCGRPVDRSDGRGV